ncbi:hypothetical protein ABIE26_003600 [Pedobacter africanus]|uniref:hypothetical protein n=1 Tax=Pedobacter africanus TaxID=151894 RepID=UPI003394BD6F
MDKLIKLTNNALLPKIVLLDLFEQHGRSVKFKDGLSLDLYKDQVMISLDMKEVEGEYKFTILTDYLAADQFIGRYELKTIEGIEQINSAAVWLTYLAGNACLCMEIFELEAEFCFRLVNGITMVYSRELHYYDEVYKILSMVPHFEKYAEENRGRLEFATERRWKW